MKAAQNGTKRRPTRKPRALVERAAAMSIQGDSNRQIARQLGVKPHTVSHMLADSDVLKKYKSELLKEVPKALGNVTLLLTPGSGQTVEELGRNTRWLLEGTQVAVKKGEVQDSTDPLEQMSREELIGLLQVKLSTLLGAA